MTQENKEILNKLLLKFNQYEKECYEQLKFLDKHDFRIEWQVTNAERKAYRICYRDLKKILMEI